jgi:hypothetical protein
VLDLFALGPRGLGRGLLVRQASEGGGDGDGGDGDGGDGECDMPGPPGDVGTPW